MRSASRVVPLLISFILTFNILASAQSANTSLRGTITDPKGAVLQGATVTISNASTGFLRTTKSANDGVYQFLEVPPATYTLTVTMAGFGVLKRDKLILQVSQPATVDVAMQVTGATEIAGRLLYRTERGSDSGQPRRFRGRRPQRPDQRNLGRPG